MEWVRKNKEVILIIVVAAFLMYIDSKRIDKVQQEYEAIGFAKGYDAVYYEYKDHLSSVENALYDRLCEECVDNFFDTVGVDGLYIRYNDPWQNVPTKEYD